MYYGNRLLFFNFFCFMLFLNFRLFLPFVLQIYSAVSTKSSRVYFVFQSNLCHRTFDVNKNHFSCKTFTTEILDINRIRYNYGEMAEITHSYFDQRYSKYIFRNSMSHNLQRAEENGDNIKYYWINLITPLRGVTTGGARGSSSLPPRSPPPPPPPRTIIL